MAKKHYQFHYAEMNQGNVINLGTLNYESTSTIDRQKLILATREHLNRPEAVIIISHVTKLSRKEFDQERVISSRLQS